jgi:hypothetical protein
MCNNRPFVYYLDGRISLIVLEPYTTFGQATDEIFEGVISHSKFQISPGFEGDEAMHKTGSEGGGDHHPHIGLRGIIGTFEEPIKTDVRFELGDEAGHNFLFTFDGVGDEVFPVLLGPQPGLACLIRIKGVSHVYLPSVRPTGAFSGQISQTRGPEPGGGRLC